MYNGGSYLTLELGKSQWEEANNERKIELIGINSSIVLQIHTSFE